MELTQKLLIALVKLDIEAKALISEFSIFMELIFEFAWVVGDSLYRVSRNL